MMKIIDGFPSDGFFVILNVNPINNDPPGRKSNFRPRFDDRPIEEFNWRDQREGLNLNQSASDEEENETTAVRVRLVPGIDYPLGFHFRRCDTLRLDDQIGGMLKLAVLFLYGGQAVVHLWIVCSWHSGCLKHVGWNSL
jgi:hypothetical protein